MVSRILGLLRDAICLGYFGTAIWHYFAIPFMLPNLFRRLFGEGALSAALIPVYTDTLENDPPGAQLLARKVLTLLVLILLGLTLIGWLAMATALWVGGPEPKTRLMLQLAIIMLPFMILICTVGAIGGLLNVHGYFGSPAASRIILNLCIICGVLFLGPLFGQDRWRQIYAVALAVVLAGFIQLFFQIPWLNKTGIGLRPTLHANTPGLYQIMKLMGPMLIGLSVIQVNVILDSLIAFTFSASPERGETFTLLNYTFNYPVREGCVGILYSAQRFYQVPLGVFGIPLATAIFPLLSRHASRKDFTALAETLNHGLRLAIVIAVPATIGIILIRTPLIQVIFQHGHFTADDTQQTAWTLLFYAFGIGAYCTQQIIVRAFYALQDSITPVKIAVRMVALNFALNLILIWPLGTGGLALSTAFCAALQVAILLIIFARRYQLDLTGNILSCLIKSIIATAVMAGGFLIISWRFQHHSAIMQLALGVATAAGLYLAVSVLIKNQDVRTLFTRNR